MAANKRKFEPELWSRNDIVCCSCSDLRYKHVHCPCSLCNGAAVSRSVEYSHWQKQQELDRLKTVTCTTGVEEPSDALTQSSSCDDIDVIAVEESVCNAGNCTVFSGSTIGTEVNANDAANNSLSGAQLAGQEESEERRLKHEILAAICEALMLVDQMQGSLNDIEDVLEYAKKLFCRNDRELTKHWPKNWRETENLLKESGYRSPKQLFVCLDDSHHTQWDVMEDPNALCRHCGKKGTIKYYYLGLCDKIRTWYSDFGMCKKMLAHWINKDAWLRGVGANFELKEVWDGSRFNELAWFWDPDSKWMLPCKCHLCGNVFSADQIRASPECNGQDHSVQCEECGKRQVVTPVFVSGDPRNIALIGHWDGWQPFGSPGRHSCGAIDVSIGNMYKEERSSTREVYVVGFVPNYLIPKKRPCALDPFLHPLISEVEEIFINGYEVDYVGDFPGLGLQPGNFIVRVLILLWTGDYPAQSEIGKFINGGIYPCRRDKLEGSLDPTGQSSTYYYGANRYRARFPWPERKLEEEVQLMSEIAEEDRSSVRQRLSRDSGYTGLSILHRLSKLYGFDVLKDLVFDLMHNLPLNVVGNLLKELIASGKLDAKVADERLKKFPWTAELKDGRLPDGLSRINHWKTEEFQKFCYPASEVILAGLLQPMDYHIWQLTTRMTELVFNRRSGWSFDDVQLFEKLAKRFNILIEEHWGLTSCRVTVHNLMHIAEDASRFSIPDCYWCYPFERAVKRYVGISSNFKNAECSFANRESHREMLKLVESLLPPKENSCFKIDIEKMFAKSLKGAQHIREVIADTPQHIESYNEGVLVGGMVSNHVNLSQQDIRMIEAVGPLFTSSNVHVPEVAVSFRSLWKPFRTSSGMLFREKEHVVIQTDDNELVCKVETFLCVEVEENTVKLVKLQKYEKLLDDEGAILTDPYSGGVLVDISVSGPLIAPVGAISRKVMLYNYEQDSNPNTRTVIDFQREKMPITVVNITVPFFPARNDMILIRGDDPDPWVAKVLTIQERAKTVRVLYYMKDEDRPGQDLYIPYRDTRLAHDTISWDCILTSAYGEWREDAFEVFLI